MTEPGAYYLVKSTRTEDPDRWDIAFIDRDNRVWVFGISGWFFRDEFLVIEPEIQRFGSKQS